MKKFIYLVFSILLILPAMAAAQDVIVTRHFSGLWQQPEHQSHGFTLHVVQQNNGAKEAVVFWFAYGEDRESAWYIGQGPVTDNRIELELYELSDIGFLQSDDPNASPADRVGTLVMSFDSCTHGTVTYDTDLPAVGSGTLPIQQLALIMNTECSGGVSDDTPADVPLTEQRIALNPARGGITGSGHADFEERADRTEFSVEVEDLADGVYRIVVGGIDRGDLVVSLGIGETEFRSPAEAGKVLLTFDPRGKVIEVHDVQGAVLSSGTTVFDGGDDGPGDDGGDDGGNDGGSDIDFGNTDIETELDNTGVFPLASGDAKLEPRADRTDFSVEIEDVPEGSYDVRIGGDIVGTIQAVMMQDGTIEGELEFRNPVEPGKILLDFDPRGQQIDVLDGATVILETLFPSS